jgi:hypothetical protein
MIRLIITSIAVLVLASACTGQGIPTDLPTKTQEAAQTEVVESTPTQPPVVSTQNTPRPYVPFFVTNTVENLVLRANPGYLFEAKTTLAPDTRLLVLGRAPGDEWIFVQTPFERTGWVYTELLERTDQYERAPVIQPADMQIVVGQVLDTGGKPVTGIQFAFVQGTTGTPPRNDATTDELGIFYAFMPLTASGTWTVSFTAVHCTSNTMDANCQCLGGICGKPDPEVTSISLPTEESLKFTWK